MANLKQLRRRIVGIRNTQQLTRAMKLVAAAKLRRAQEAVEAVRPYARAVEELTARLCAQAGGLEHPLLAPRPMRKVRVLVFTSDKGLCGTFNTNVCRAVEQYLRTKSAAFESVELAIIGRKGTEYLTKRGYTPAHKYPGSGAHDAVSADTLARTFASDYQDGTVDGVFLVYNEFLSAMVQRLTWKQLLPLELPEAKADDAADYLQEPQPMELLERLLGLRLHATLHRALLESLASEMGARMTAMDSATKNAKELIEKLTLAANKARQEAITRELIDIVGGAEALNG
jgi:F-type H+-transporting ATPase subunit gamma